MVLYTEEKLKDFLSKCDIVVENWEISTLLYILNTPKEERRSFIIRPRRH